MPVGDSNGYHHPNLSLYEYIHTLKPTGHSQCLVVPVDSASYSHQMSFVPQLRQLRH